MTVYKAALAYAVFSLISLGETKAQRRARRSR
jgi:hypothetical protein